MVQAHPGTGIAGVVNGRRFLVGNQRMMGDAGVSLESAAARLAELTFSARSVVFVAEASPPRLLGIIGIADEPRPTAAAGIARLKRLGLNLILITGDNQATAEAIVRTVAPGGEIESVIAAVLPGGKADAIADLQRGGHLVAMIGDGINDAPALAQADVGIAIGSGTDVAVEASDITLMRADLDGVAEAMALSRKTLAVIKQNLFWAFIYNVLGIPIAAGVLYPFTGWLLSPMVAAAAMSISSVSVVLNSLRLRHA